MFGESIEDVPPVPHRSLVANILCDQQPKTRGVHLASSTTGKAMQLHGKISFATRLAYIGGQFATAAQTCGNGLRYLRMKSRVCAASLASPHL